MQFYKKILQVLLVFNFRLIMLLFSLSENDYIIQNCSFFSPISVDTNIVSSMAHVGSCRWHPYQDFKQNSKQRYFVSVL